MYMHRQHTHHCHDRLAWGACDRTHVARSLVPVQQDASPRRCGQAEALAAAHSTGAPVAAIASALVAAAAAGPWVAAGVGPQNALTAGAAAAAGAGVAPNRCCAANTPAQMHAAEWYPHQTPVAHTLGRVQP